MNIFKNDFPVEIIHFVIALSITFVIDIISKSKYKLLLDDKYIDRIRKDKNSFINYIAIVVLCAVLSVVFSNEIMNVFKWTFSFLTVLSMGQCGSFSKFKKETKNERYLKVIEIVDYMFIACWGKIILVTLMNFNDFWVTVGIMAFFTVASLWALKELKKIESDYLSAM